MSLRVRKQLCNLFPSATVGLLQMLMVCHICNLLSKRILKEPHRAEIRRAVYITEPFVCTRKNTKDYNIVLQHLQDINLTKKIMKKEKEQEKPLY